MICPARQPLQTKVAAPERSDAERQGMLMSGPERRVLVDLLTASEQELIRQQEELDERVICRNAVA